MLCALSQTHTVTFAMVTDLTINVLVRQGLRLNPTQYSNDYISFKIKQALYFLNRITSESYTISDYDNAHSDNGSGTDYYFDELISLRALWAIHLEIYQQSVNRGDDDRSTKHISTIYEQQFMVMLAARYPGLVTSGPGGGLTFNQKAFPSSDVGANDGREAAENAIIFDQTPRYPSDPDNFDA